MGTNAGEQFYMFVIVASWLIRKANNAFDTPQQSDDPNATVASILDHVRKSVRLVISDSQQSRSRSIKGARTSTSIRIIGYKNRSLLSVIIYDDI